MKAAGKWTWWNPYGTVPLETCVRRCVDAKIGCIVKANYNSVFDAFTGAGVPVAVERYVYPNNEGNEALYLADGVRRGAEFIVIDPEVEWERLGANPMERLMNAIQSAAPGVEIYGCVDTRGNRASLPYQQVLVRRAAGIMPMIYPLDFYPSRPPSYVARAFADSLAGKNFSGQPVLPTLQTYGGIGPIAVGWQLDEVNGSHFLGCQAYTVGHATFEEWATFAQHTTEEKEEMAAKEELERVRAAIGFGNLLEDLARQAYNNQPGSLDKMAQVEFVFALAKAHR